MVRVVRILLVSVLVLWQLGCGGAGSPNGAKSGAPGQVPGPDISISPGSTDVGSPDLTVTVSGSQQFLFTSDPHKSNQVVWSGIYGDTLLDATFVSGSQLTAIVPENLLAFPYTAQVRVEIRDDQGGLEAKSSPATFRVVVPPPSIRSMSPVSVPAGSDDVTLTINGSNFYHFGFRYVSVAFWTTCGNLHDCGTMLDTGVVSNTELSATIPAALLQKPTSVQIVVLTGDIMGMGDGFFGYPRSNSVTFTVSP